MWRAGSVTVRASFGGAGVNASLSAASVDIAAVPTWYASSSLERSLMGLGKKLPPC